MSRRKYTLPKLEGNGKEGTALTQFKARVADLITTEDDYTLKKWLKARNFDVDKAETMFRTSKAYRERMKVDTLLNDYTPPEVLTKYLTGGTCGHDKEGSPIRVELFGLLDMKGLMHSARKSDMERVKLVQCEQHVQDWKEMSEKLNRRVDGLTVIFDMDKVSTKMLWRPGLQMYLHLVRVLEDNYPEMLKRMFVINAPRIFPILYKICRPLISEDTKNKIHILGGDYTSTLLKYIDAEELPAFLGGTKTDSDGNPRCATMISQGGLVPEEYYLKDLDNSDSLETVTVSRGDTFSVEVQVDKPGSILRWEFKTDGYDIGFGVFRQDGDEQVPVLEMERVNSHMVAEDGSITCTQPGTYVVKFDNSYSKVRDKRLKYFIDLLVGEDTEKIALDMKTDFGPCPNHSDHWSCEVLDAYSRDCATVQPKQMQCHKLTDKLVWDNSFSWARGKTVYYCTDLLPPLTDEITKNELTRMLEQGVDLSTLADENIVTTKL